MLPLQKSKILLQKFIELDLANKIILWCQTQYQDQEDICVFYRNKENKKIDFLFGFFQKKCYMHHRSKTITCIWVPGLFTVCFFATFYGGGDKNVVKKVRHQKSEHIMYLFLWVNHKQRSRRQQNTTSFTVKGHRSLNLFSFCAHCIVPFTLGLIVQRKSNITCKTLIARACSHKQFSVKGFALKEENRECTNYQQEITWIKSSARRVI